MEMKRKDGVRKARCLMFHAEWSWVDAMVSTTFRLEKEKLNSARSVSISLKRHF